jgi:RHS repeat-associated protein
MAFGSNVCPPTRIDSRRSSFWPDRAERLTNARITSGSALIDLAYATANGSGDYANGKLKTATRHNWISGVDNQVVETYTYGGVGGTPSARSTTVEGQSLTQGFTWTDLGLPASVTYPQISGIGPARTVSDSYSNGFLTSVPSYASSITYSVNAMPYQITHANNVVATYGLDGHNIQRIAGVTTAYASSNNLALTPFAYDGAGDIKAIGGQTFVYDQVSRLVTGNIFANGTPKTQSTTFDAFGNITSTTTTDWGTQTFSLSAATNRLNSPVTYDSAGDVTSWGGFAYTWDALGKLQTVTGTGINHTYLYTADGERISDRDANASTTTLTVRGLDGKVLRIYGKSGSTWSWSKDYVYQQGLLLAEVDSSATRSFQLDQLGTPRLITGSGGTTLAIHDYYPFGMEAAGTADGERMKFTGHELDGMGTAGQGDDLYNMHARFYNANIARFLSADLLRGDPHQPQSFNLFAYVGGNPISRFDPLGLQTANQTPDEPACMMEDQVQCVGGAPTLPSVTVSTDPGTNVVPTPIIIVLGGGGGASASNALHGLLIPPPRPCPTFKRTFFDTLGSLLKQMAAVTQTDPGFIAALASFESGWLSPHAQETHNPFGLTRGGGRNLTFPSYEAAANYWLYEGGADHQGWSTILRGTSNIISFATTARDNGYNVANPNWVDDIARQYSTSILPYEAGCGF